MIKPMERHIGPTGIRPGASANPHRAAQILADAETCRRTGKLDRAQSLCESLLQNYPDYVGALQTLGVTQLIKKNYRQALSCFIQAAMLCPKDCINLTNLATAYLHLGARELAAQTLEQARQLKPDDANVDFTLAAVYREDREYEMAAAAYRKVLGRLPTHAEAAHGLGDCCSHLGRVAEAAAALKQAHACNPDSVAILYALSQLPASANDVNILGALEGVRREHGQSQDDFDSFVAFTRAAALDRQGRHSEAWLALQEANRREFPKHEAEYRKQNARMEAARHDARQTRARADVRGRASKSYPLSIFIVGPSRSGKTTVERLLGQLEGVKCGYESRLVERASRRASQLSGLLTMRNPSDLPKALDAKFREFYSEEVQEFGRGAKIVTDTYPAMIPYVGRVATALPNVRFIFVKRDRYDCALRIFMKHYRAGNHYAYDIRTIFHYVIWYYEMVELWFEKFPEISFSIDYEDAVAEPKATLSRIVEFCGTNVDVRFPLDLGDDQGCSRSYREFIDTALREDRRDLFWLR
jgi:tetratricopeptide (TPR) repeat protein